MFQLPAISIPVLIFFLLYGVYLIGFIAFSLFNLLHLVKFGVASSGLYFTIALFLAGSILLATGSLYWLMSYDPSFTWSPEASSSFIQKNVFPGL